MARRSASLAVLVLLLISAAVSAQVPKKLPPVPAGIYPETGSLHSGWYRNFYFNFALPLPPAEHREYLRISPPGTHTLLALSFTDQSRTGSMAVFATEPGSDSSNDPAIAAKEEALAHKSERVYWVRQNEFSACRSNSTVCTRYVFHVRRGYLLRFVANSDTPILSAKMAHAFAKLEFPVEPMRSSGKGELYEGPSIPAHVLERAFSSKITMPEASLGGGIFRISSLGLEYGLPLRWKELPLEAGTERFEHYRSPGEDELSKREHRFFQACSSPLLHLQQEQEGTIEPSDMSLLVISPSCLGLSLPAQWSDKDAVADLATRLSLLYDFGGVTASHYGVLSGYPFLTLEGTMGYVEADSTLKKRRYQSVYVTQAGDWLLAWFLTTHKQQPAVALPASRLIIGGVSDIQKK